MRQKAVSIAPQKEAPIQIPPTAATIPIVVELERTRSIVSISESAADVGEEALEVEDDAVLDVGALDEPAEDEEDEQREGEDRQHQVVGDHRREAGDVLLVGAVPERLQPRPAPGAWDTQRPPGFQDADPVSTRHA